MTHAMSVMAAFEERKLSDSALHQALLYASSSLDIATGPYPEVNLLDMLVFLHLSGAVFDTYWAPHVFREHGGDAARVFHESEEVLSRIADHSLDESARAGLTRVLDAWLAERPSTIAVEWVRFDDFAENAGAAAAQRMEGAAGVLSSVRTATRTADEALVAAERAMFLVHRLPFLFRMQVRLAVRESLADALRILRVEVPVIAAFRALSLRWSRWLALRHAG
jgi:hypothetical protein